MSAEETVGGYRRATASAAVVRLDLNEPPREAGGSFRPRLLEILASSPWHRYPDMDASAARGAAAAVYGWSPDGTLVGNGSNELLGAACRALLPSGGTMAALWPSFSMYPVMAARQGVRLARIALRAPEFQVDTRELLEAVWEADMVTLCSPNNPTGGELDEGLWSQVLALGKPVIWDAAYAEFAAARPVELLRRFANLGVLRSLSKAWGVAGLRVGALLASPELTERVQAHLNPFGTGWAVEAAYRAAAELREEGAVLVGEVVEERQRLLEAVAGLAGFETVPSAANFFLMRRRSLCGRELAGALRERGIAVREVEELDGDGYVRVTVGTRAEGDLLLRAIAEVACE